MFFKISPKSHHTLGYFSHNICQKDLSEIVQCGHTDHCTAGLLYRFGFSCFAVVNEHQFYLYGQIKPVNQEVSRTVILPPLVSVFSVDVIRETFSEITF